MTVTLLFSQNSFSINFLELRRCTFFPKIIHGRLFFVQNVISSEFKKKNSQDSIMGNLVDIGLHELRALFGAYEQFVSHLWNVFFRL